MHVCGDNVHPLLSTLPSMSRLAPEQSCGGSATTIIPILPRRNVAQRGHVNSACQGRQAAGAGQQPSAAAGRGHISSDTADQDAGAVWARPGPAAGQRPFMARLRAAAEVCQNGVALRKLLERLCTAPSRSPCGRQERLVRRREGRPGAAPFYHSLMDFANILEKYQSHQDPKIY